MNAGALVAGLGMWLVSAIGVAATASWAVPRWQPDHAFTARRSPGRAQGAWFFCAVGAVVTVAYLVAQYVLYPAGLVPVPSAVMPVLAGGQLVWFVLAAVAIVLNGARAVRCAHRRRADAAVIARLDRDLAAGAGS